MIMMTTMMMMWHEDVDMIILSGDNQWLHLAHQGEEVNDDNEKDNDDNDKDSDNNDKDNDDNDKDNDDNDKDNDENMFTTRWWRASGATRSPREPLVDGSTARFLTFFWFWFLWFFWFCSSPLLRFGSCHGIESFKNFAKF